MESEESRLPAVRCIAWLGVWLAMKMVVPNLIRLNIPQCFVSPLIQPESRFSPWRERRIELLYADVRFRCRPIIMEDEADLGPGVITVRSGDAIHRPLSGLEEVASADTKQHLDRYKLSLNRRRGSRLWQWPNLLIARQLACHAHLAWLCRESGKAVGADEKESEACAHTPNEKKISYGHWDCGQSAEKESSYRNGIIKTQSSGR